MLVPIAVSTVHHRRHKTTINNNNHHYRGGSYYGIMMTDLSFDTCSLQTKTMPKTTPRVTHNYFYRRDTAETRTRDRDDVSSKIRNELLRPVQKYTVGAYSMLPSDVSNNFVGDQKSSSRGYRCSSLSFVGPDFVRNNYHDARAKRLVIARRKIFTA